IRLEPSVTSGADAAEARDTTLGIMCIVRTNGDRPQSITDRTGRRGTHRVVFSEMRLASRTRGVPFDPRVKASINDIRADQAHLPRSGWSSLVQKDIDVMIEAIRLLITVIHVADFSAPYHQARAFTQLNVCRRDPFRRTDSHVELV